MEGIVNAPEVRIRTWVRASEADEATGLLGFLSLTYGDLVLDGVTLRRTTEGRFALSFPARTDRGGKRHPYFRPIDDAARQRIEREILKGLVENQESQP
jgi:DNA-binding cell septation regulator SpoVG